MYYSYLEQSATSDGRLYGSAPPGQRLSNDADSQEGQPNPFFVKIPVLNNMDNPSYQMNGSGNYNQMNNNGYNQMNGGNNNPSDSSTTQGEGNKDTRSLIPSDHSSVNSDYPSES